MATDVCAVLGLTNASKALAGLDDDQRTLSTAEGRSNNGVPVNMINEPGLYTLIFRSRKEEAKAFQRWVTAEVLRLLRRAQAA